MEYPNLEPERTNANWIDYKIRMDTWMSGEDEIVFDDVLFHPQSLTSGWLKIAKGFYDFQDDESFGVVSPRPNADMDYVRAYRVSLYIKETGTVNWTASNVGNRRSWENAYRTFYQEINANAGKVAHLKKLKSILDDTGKGDTRYMDWELVKWVNPPDDFVLESSPAETTAAPDPFASNDPTQFEDDVIPF
jgi:hypothetical protein|tara:strand:- start:383 stop:955 length:573 start_codon:yes stop_codon:yes gene_type:complete